MWDLGGIHMHMLTREEKINTQGEVCGASFLTSKWLKTLSTHQDGFFKILSLDACVLYKVAFPHDLYKSAHVQM